MAFHDDLKNSGALWTILVFDFSFDEHLWNALYARHRAERWRNATHGDRAGALPSRDLLAGSGHEG